MAHYPEFFDYTSDYSFKNYLSYVETKGNILRQANLDIYKHWYLVECDAMKDKAKKEANQLRLAKITAAIKALKNMTTKNAQSSIKTKETGSSSTTFNTYHLEHSQGNTIGDVHCTTFAPQPMPTY